MWRQADVATTGLATGSFDVGLCQQGLQFFADRLAAVRELHRLLVPDGRVVVSTWCESERSGYEPIRSALERHVPQVAEATSFLDAVFGLGDAARLVALLREGGFRDVGVAGREYIVRFGSPEAWVRAFLSAAPVPFLARLDSEVIARIVRDASDRLERHVSTQGFQFPIAANIATGFR